MRNPRPYKNIDWNHVSTVQSFQHSHFYPRTKPGYHRTSEENYQDVEARQERFENMYNQGVNVFGVSNYNPAVPDLYPLESHINDMKDAISYPNTEQRGFGEHFCQLGSLHESHRYDEDRERWDRVDDLHKRIEDAFDAIIDEMVYDDGGGITINHPKRMETKKEDLLRYLNHSEWVLGVEVYNYRSHRKYASRGMAFDLWDSVLSAGVQCFGFFAPDMHLFWDNETEARTYLFVPEVTERACLKAYKKGNFFGAIHGTGLRFTKIVSDDNKIQIETDTGTEIRFIGDKGVLKTVTKNIGEYTLTGNEVYVRVEVDDKENKLAKGHYWSQSYETIFSQPIMLKKNIKL